MKEAGSGAMVAGGTAWLLPLRLLMVIAWCFNVVLLAVLLLNAWKNDHDEKLLGMGFLLCWLVGSFGWIGLRSVFTRR